jgi:predicted methyltransferase
MRRGGLDVLERMHGPEGSARGWPWPASTGWSCYTAAMLRRLGRLLAAVLLLGCTPSSATTAAPSAAAREAEAGHDPARDPAEGGDAAAAGPGETEALVAAGPAAPERVEITINDDYAQQQNPARWATRFEREGREVFDHQDEILAALGLREGMVVADVGAGTGLFTLAIAERVGPKGVVYAVDVQPYFLDHIGQKAKKAKLDNVRLVRATQGSAELPAGAVDLVLMCDSYHHVEQPAPYLASLRAALRPGGRLVIVDYIAIEGQSPKWRLEHVRATPAEFRAEIESAGFRFVKAHDAGLEENFFFEFARP